MIAPRQFAITNQYIECTSCNSTLHRVDSTGPVTWADAVQNFIEQHKQTCELKG